EEDEEDEEDENSSHEPPRPVYARPVLDADGHNFELGPLTAMNPRYFVMQNRQNEPARTIRRRNLFPMVIYSEQADMAQSPEGLADYLTLDVYDILRPCQVEPYLFIEDREINVPLESLRNALARQVRNQRRQDEVRQDPTPSSPVVRPPPPRSASLPSRYLDDVKQPARKKRRGV
ncbi:hypothetical protein FRC06_004379, partial [Ceratobasidium sp. 370]